ncbi:MAG: TIM barrel protein [Nanoarchaeota archaeon]
MEKRDYNSSFDYSISDIYQGGYSSLLPPSDSYITTGSLGMTTDPRTANILQDVSLKLASGVKHVEIEAVSPEVFDSIPNQQLKEVHRLSKLTGTEVSMHAPVLNTSGIDPRSGFSESEREAAERRVTNALLRARELNPDGNIPVNFHSGEGIQGSQFLPPSKRKEKEKYEIMMVVNRDTGRLAPLGREEEFHLGGEVKEISKTPEQRLNNLNATEWKNSLFQVEVNRENAERIMQDIHPIFIARFTDLQTKKLKPEELTNEERAQMGKVSSAFEFIEQAKMSADNLFDKAYKAAKMDNDEKNMNSLKKLSVEYGKLIGVEEDKKNPEKYFNPKIHAEALQELIHIMENFPPRSYVPIEEFAVEQSSKTFGNAAYNSYKEFKGKNVPLMVIENPPAGFALSTGEDIKNIVEASRKRFVENATQDGMSESQAEKEAEKLIGATWDVGHINMLRKFGYSEEEIVKETEKVADYVKHVHLSDNFGFEHTELPMGMGNVPLKEMMKKLGEKGFEAKKIIEAGQWYQHFKTPPFQETIEAMGSPVYAMKMAPYWSQAAGLYQGYSSGLGQMLPQMNYETFGTGFSRLPSELGGTMQTSGSRMSGRQME